MGGSDGGATPAEQSPSKRRYSHQSHHRASKKRKLNPESETLNVVTSAARTPPRPYYPKSSHSSPQTSEKYKEHRRIKCSNPDGYRKWVFSARDLSCCKDKIVFVSYNILGVENASKHPDLYANVLPKYLDWDHRKNNLHKEISQYNTSILCLQEVDRFNDLDELFKKDGFVGIHQARTGEACDGCAIFWKNKLFTLLHQENIEFEKFGLRNNVAQFCVLKMNQKRSSPSVDAQTLPACSPRRLLIGNIHVLFNPKRGDIKLGQVRLFLEKAYELSQEWGNIPVILGGDLNSMPKSAMYKFLASSELDLLLNDRRNISGQACQLESQAFQSYYTYQGRNNYTNSSWKPVWRTVTYRWSDEELRLATGTRGTRLRHPLKLCSAYLGVHGSLRTRDKCGEPLATSYHSKFMGTVDYVWHSQELVPVRVLDTLPLDILRKMGGLPNKNWGSDHLALVCELAFADDCNEA